MNRVWSQTLCGAPGISSEKWHEHYGEKIIQTGPLVKVVGDAASKQRAEEATAKANAFENIPRDAAGYEKAARLHTEASDAHKAAGNEERSEQHREFAAHAQASYEDMRVVERAGRKAKPAYRPKY